MPTCYFLANQPYIARLPEWSQFMCTVHRNIVRCKTYLSLQIKNIHLRSLATMRNSVTRKHEVMQFVHILLCQVGQLGLAEVQSKQLSSHFSFRWHRKPLFACTLQKLTYMECIDLTFATVCGQSDLSVIQPRALSSGSVSFMIDH